MTTLLVIIIVILTIILISNKSKYTRLKSELESKKNENSDFIKKISELEQRISELSKYSGLVDIEQKANEIINEANQLKEVAQNELAQAILDAEKVRDQAAIEAMDTKNEVINNLNNTKIDVANSRREAVEKLNNATIEARKILENAQSKAIQIAGDAYRAMQNSEEFRRTAVAMKNIIDGYGDEYLIPTYSLLDDLAEEFSHTEAGEKLRFAREKSRLMIKNGTAAKCDYVETNRKETAVTFVLDAFNGKVDSILSKVKKDNYGILEQKIKDSFQFTSGQLK